MHRDDALTSSVYQVGDSCNTSVSEVNDRHFAGRKDAGSHSPRTNPQKKRASVEKAFPAARVQRRLSGRVVFHVAYFAGNEGLTAGSSEGKVNNAIKGKCYLIATDVWHIVVGVTDKSPYEQADGDRLC